MGDLYLDYGPVLPEAYGRDALEALAVAPDSIFVFWERTWEPPGGGACALILRESSSGNEQAIDAARTGRYLFRVQPGRRYRAIIGYREGDSFVVRQSSCEVATPVAGSDELPPGSSRIGGV